MEKRKRQLRTAGKLFFGGVLGYIFFWLTSNPTKSPVRRRLPEKSIKNISYFPNIKIARKNKEYWLHHWMNLSVLYIVLFLAKKKVIKSKVANGFLLGSILQGLTYKDRFRVITSTATLVANEKTDKSK